MMFVFVLLLSRTNDLETVLCGKIGADLFDECTIVALASDGIVWVAARVGFAFGSTSTSSSGNQRVE